MDFNWKRDEIQISIISPLDLRQISALSVGSFPLLRSTQIGNKLIKQANSCCCDCDCYCYCDCYCDCLNDSLKKRTFFCNSSKEKERKEKKKMHRLFGKPKPKVEAPTLDDTSSAIGGRIADCKSF